MAAVLWLLPVAVAEGKGIAAIKVCGANDCREVGDTEHLAMVAFGGAPGDPPPAAAYWYRAHVAVHGDGSRERFTTVVLPSMNRVRGEDGPWMHVSDEDLAPFRHLVRGLDPKPAAALNPELLAGPRAGVAQVVQPPAEPVASRGSAWPWFTAAGVVALLGLAGAGVKLRRRRRRGLRPTAPAEGS
jgi:LPXTG-motif cell wall-anchored protein